MSNAPAVQPLLTAGNGRASTSSKRLKTSGTRVAVRVCVRATPRAGESNTMKTKSNVKSGKANFAGTWIL